MQETLHHKLNSAIMAWYLRGFFSLSLNYWSSALAPTHCTYTALCMVITAGLAGFACAMCDVRCEQ